MLSAMSSSKHQPNLRKRPIDLVASEFPPIPAISLEATMEFAAKSQEALRSVPTISTNLSSLFLPLISAHQLQQRFKVKESAVFVVMRKSYPFLKNEVDSLNMEDFCGIYVRGPVGVGKSYLLYLMAVEYRLNRESYRVTYINDSAAWRTDRFGYILRELITTFFDDIIDEKSMVTWCRGVTGSDKEEKMMMIEALVNYTHENNLIWVIICDQHNALFNPSVFKDFPFSLINYLSKHRGSNIKIVISASANNEGYPTEMKGWQTHDIMSHRFDQEEFKVWCDYYLLEDNMKVNHESEEAMDALFWTGGVPYELDLLWKQPRKTLIEKTMLYRQNRVSEMAESHAKFYKTLVDKEKDNLAECISRMALGLSAPEIMVGMDRQLFDIIKDGDTGDGTITALNPVARRALISFHGRDLMNSLGFVAEIVLKGAIYPNNIKGKISEMYITTMLELSPLFAFQFRKVANIAKIGLPDDATQRKGIEIKSVVHFLTNKLPPKTSFHKNLTTLFVPDSPNYPRFDFFIWDSERQVIMGFQVTVLNPFSDHPKMTNSQTWQRFCFSNSKQTPMELYWVVPKRCIGADTASV